MQFFCHALSDDDDDSVDTDVGTNSYQSARRYNPEDSHLHSHRRENLKSYTAMTVLLLFVGLARSTSFTANL
jgi:hypothetical protein